MSLRDIGNSKFTSYHQDTSLTVQSSKESERLYKPYPMGVEKVESRSKLHGRRSDHINVVTIGA